MCLLYQRLISKQKILINDTFVKIFFSFQSNDNYQYIKYDDHSHNKQFKDK
jgi:hypothetical protein